MTPSQIAINTVTLKHESLPKTLEACAGAGFVNIEMPLGQIKPFLAEGGGVAAAKALFDDLGLRFIGGFEAGIVAFGNGDERAANRALHLANAELIASLGGTVMVVGTDGPEKKSLDALKTVAETCRELAEAMPDTVTLAVEFNWSPLVKSVRSAALVAEYANHPRVGVLFDPAHFYCTPSKTEDLTPDTVKRIAHVHVDDMNGVPGDLANCNSDRALPGEGVIDLTALFGIIERHGYGGYFSLEMFSDALWAMPAADAARKCYGAMQTLTD